MVASSKNASRPVLRDQKHEAVRQAMYDAAIELFAAKGFDETTVEDIASAVGASRRTFFRYFQTKDELLAFPVMNYTRALAAAAEACPRSYPPARMLRETVLAGVRFTTADEHKTRLVVTISTRSASARLAYQSRMLDVQEMLAKAFSTHFADSASYDFRPGLLAAMTLTVMHASIIAWLKGDHHDLEAAATEALEKIRLILCTDPAASGTESRSQVTSSGRSTFRARR